MELKRYRLYLKTDYLGLSIDAEKVERDGDYIFFSIGYRTVVLIAVDRIERIEYSGPENEWRGENIFPVLAAPSMADFMVA